jgi:hypothetical protein
MLKRFIDGMHAICVVRPHLDRDPPVVIQCGQSASKPAVVGSARANLL